MKGLDNPPGIIMAIDYIHVWNSWKTPIEAEGIIGHTIIARVEQAIKYNADAVKVYYALGLEPEFQLKVIEGIMRVVSECDKHDMPIMIEPTTDGWYIPPTKKGDPKIIADGCRFAFEMGADIIKAPYPECGNKEAFAEICANVHVPVVMLGGPKREGVRGILETAQNGVEAGAKGTIFGRNIWQRPEDEMKRLVKALQDIVHRGAGVEEVLGRYALE
jgi:class I fructose-bisphosphate aldolase